MEDKVTLHLTVKGDERRSRCTGFSGRCGEHRTQSKSDEKDFVDVMIQSDPKTEIRDMIFTDYGLSSAQPMP